MIASRFGKIPTLSKQSRISRLRRPLGLFDQVWDQNALAQAAWREGIEVVAIDGLCGY